MTSQRIRDARRDVDLLESGWAPPPEMLADAPLLEDWLLARHPMGDVCLVGRCTGHPRLPDGPTNTSPVVALDPAAGWARTVSRWYRLGRKLTPRPAGESLGL